MGTKVVVVVVVGTKKKAGWFETQDGRKLRLKSLAVAKPALVASQQQYAVADSESLKNESRSVVADQESLRCQNCQRQFSTVTGRKVHQTRFCKAGLSKNVVVKSKFEQLEASLTCDKCERKFKTVNGRKVKQSMAEKFTNRDTVANLKQLPHACFPAKYKMFSETSLKT